MFNVIDAQSTVTAVGRFQAYPVLMSLLIVFVVLLVEDEAISHDSCWRWV